MKKYSISSLLINYIFGACKIRAHALGGQKWPRSCQPRPLAEWGTEPQTSIGQKFVVDMPGMPNLAWHARHAYFTDWRARHARHANLKL